MVTIAILPVASFTKLTVPMEVITHWQNHKQYNHKELQLFDCTWHLKYSQYLAQKYK